MKRLSVSLVYLPERFFKKVYKKYCNSRMMNYFYLFTLIFNLDSLTPPLAGWFNNHHTLRLSLVNDVFHSYLSESAGLELATLIVWKLMVIRAMIRAINPARTNIQTLI